MLTGMQVFKAPQVSAVSSTWMDEVIVFLQKTVVVPTTLTPTNNGQRSPSSAPAGLPAG
jgi:hypothetical protein